MTAHVLSQLPAAAPPADARGIRNGTRLGARLRLANAVAATLVERVAMAALVALALGFGFGDIAQVSRQNAFVLTTLHSLLLGGPLLALASALLRGRWRLVPRTVAIPTAIWLVVLLVSAATAPGHSSDAMAALERPASGALLACAVCALCRDRRRWLLLAKSLAIGGLTIALIGLAEATGAPAVLDWLAGLRDGAIPIGDVPRVAATLSHPNVASMLFKLSVPLLVAWAWTARHAWRLLLRVGAAATLLAIVLTFSRAGMVAALASLALLARLCRASPERQRRLLTLGALALVVPLALGWASLADPGLSRRLRAGVDESSPSQPPRTAFWAIAIDMARNRPLLGVGPDNFRWQFAAYSGFAADNLGIHAHNQYLETLADAGLLGLLSYTWLLFALVGRSTQGLRVASTSEADRPWRVALLASLSAWLLHALLDDFERFWPASVAFWLVAALSIVQPGNDSRASNADEPPRRTEGRLRCLAVEQPEHGTDDGNHHQQHQNARWTRQRGAAAAPAAEADHAAYCPPGTTRGSRSNSVVCSASAGPRVARASPGMACGGECTHAAKHRAG